MLIKYQLSTLRIEQNETENRKRNFELGKKIFFVTCVGGSPMG
jgi:hypothetical protein